MIHPAIMLCVLVSQPQSQKEVRSVTPGKLILGSWEVVAANSEGAPFKLLEGKQITIGFNFVDLPHLKTGERVKLKCRVRAKTDPPRIEWSGKSDSGEWIDVLGIFRASNETATICVGVVPRSERKEFVWPRKLESPKGSGLFVLTLSRRIGRESGKRPELGASQAGSAKQGWVGKTGAPTLRGCVK